MVRRNMPLYPVLDKHIWLPYGPYLVKLVLKSRFSVSQHLASVLDNIVGEHSSMGKSMSHLDHMCHTCICSSLLWSQQQCNNAVKFENK